MLWKKLLGPSPTPPVEEHLIKSDTSLVSGYVVNSHFGTSHSRQAIPPLVDLLSCSDVRIVMATLEGLENILRVGEKDAQHTGWINHRISFNNAGINAYTVILEDCGGIDMLEELQNHPVCDPSPCWVRFLTSQEIWDLWKSCQDPGVIFWSRRRWWWICTSSSIHRLCLSIWNEASADTAQRRKSPITILVYINTTVRDVDR